MKLKLRLNNKLDLWAAVLLFAMVFSCTATGFSQEGVSSMSMGMSRAGLIPLFDQIRIEEYINYHRHEIPRPEGDQAVRLDLKWNRLPDDRAVVQVGLATAPVGNPDLMPPLNLVLVIDRSGSMSGDRIAKVKDSLHALIGRLRATDRVTVVSFSDSARVDLEPCDKTKKKKIRQAIERIDAGGSTNLHGGLMLGYQMAEQNLDQDRTSRVILLTDGIANVGTIDPATIAAESRAFNKKGISLSTIGLGGNLNQELLRNLADAGRGLIHFVDDAADIEKTFVREIDSLLAPAARKIRLTVESSSAQPARVYGYQPETRENQSVFRIDDLNRGATQIVLSEWELSATPVEIRVRLEYVDAVSGEPQEQTASVRLDGEAPDDMPVDPDLEKNYQIAVVAGALRESARLFHAGQSRQAARILGKTVRSVREQSVENDADIVRMLDIARDYQQKMKTAAAMRRPD